MKKEFLIGGSKDLHNIITMEIETTTRNGYLEFTASFSEGELFNVEERNEDARDWYEEIFDCSDNESKLFYLQDGDRTKDEWIDACLDEECDYRDRIDCSCTDYEISKDGETYNFETIGGGQLDPRECDYFEPVNETVAKLLEFWDNYHLKEITKEQENELCELCEKMEDFEDVEKIIVERIVL